MDIKKNYLVVALPQKETLIKLMAMDYKNLEYFFYIFNNSS